MSDTYFGVRVTGPLAPYADGFHGWLIQCWYAPSTAEGQLRLTAHLSRWLASRRLDCSALTDEVVGQFLRARRRGYRNLVSGRGLGPLLEYLRMLGVTPEAAAPAAITATARLLLDYRRHLLIDRGLADGTVQGYVAVADRFVHYCAQRGAPDLSAVTAAHVADFVLAEAARRRSGSARQVVPALRSLLRFCQLRGLTAPSLVLAVPTAPNRRDASLPRPLTARQVARLLGSCDRRTAMGRRDYAILVMLSRLGLRAGELTALRLEDVHWRAGEIEVIGKGGRRERLPLPEDVGEALVGYLQRGRPPTGDRHVFVRHCAPRSALTSAAVSRMVRAVGERAGVAVSGAHQLRHTTATDLLRAGAPLSEVSQVLRHRRPATTAMYAKVDRAALLPLAPRWPVGIR